MKELIRNPKIMVPAVALLCVIAFSFAYSSGNAVREMRLEKFQGQLSFFNGTKEKTPVEGARLQHEDQILTYADSRAYLLLDETKIVQMDQESDISIEKEGKHLDIHVHSGSIFFHVTAALSQEETLEFHTNNVVTGVRGTAGVVSYDSDTQVTQIAVLSGSVSGATQSEEKIIQAGEMGIVTTLPDGTVTFEVISTEYSVLPSYYQNSFINYLQTELTWEGKSFAYSEMLRESNHAVALPEEISVLGEVRTLSGKQAQAYGKILEGMDLESTEVAFFHGGDGVPVMVTRQEMGNITKLMTLHQWNGSKVVDLDNENLEYYVKQLGEDFVITTQMGYSEEVTDGNQILNGQLCKISSFAMEQGMMRSFPYRISFYASPSVRTHLSFEEYVQFLSVGISLDDFQGHLGIEKMQEFLQYSHELPLKNTGTVALPLEECYVFEQGDFEEYPMSEYHDYFFEENIELVLSPIFYEPLNIWWNSCESVLNSLTSP